MTCAFLLREALVGLWLEAVGMWWECCEKLSIENTSVAPVVLKHRMHVTNPHDNCKIQSSAWENKKQATLCSKQRRIRVWMHLVFFINTWESKAMAQEVQKNATLWANIVNWIGREWRSLLEKETHGLGGL